MRDVATAGLASLALLTFGCGGGGYEGLYTDVVRSQRHGAEVQRAGARAAHEASPPGGPATLPALLAFAAEHAPLLIQARAALASGRAEEIGARAPVLGAPEIDVTAGARQRAPRPALLLAASLRQPFEISGARGARIDAARHFVRSSRAQLAVAEWEVHRAVHAAFSDVLVAREEARVSARLAEFAARVATFAQRRVAAGESSPLELRVAEGEAAQSAQEAAAAAGRYELARIALATECGWPTARPPDPAGTLDPPRDPPAVDGLVRLALSRHSVLQQAAIEVARARAAVTVADREAWPMASIGVQVEREGSENLVLGTVGGALPIFAVNQAARARARAEVVRSRAGHEALEVLVPARVARAHAAVTSAVARVHAYGTEILPRFEESLALLTRALELGEIDVVELSVASQRFLTVQRDALEATAEYHRALSELEAAVGVDDAGRTP